MSHRLAETRHSDVLICVVGCALAILLLLGSFYLSGAPYYALVVAIAMSVIGWACLKPKRFIYILVVYCCIYPYMISDLGLPRLLSYGGDALNILAFLFALRSGKLHGLRWGSLLVPLGLFCGVSLLSAVGHAASPILVLWEARNVFRFFVFLVACLGLLDTDDLAKLCRLLFAIFVINLFLCSYESLVLHYGQDNTNGLFGSGSGGNAATNILLLEMTCLTLFGYGRKQVSLPILLFVIAGSCYISIIAELKFYFVQLAFAIILYVLISKPSLKNAAIVVILFVGLYIAIQLFYAYMPRWANYFDVGNLFESSTEGGYGNSLTLNRLTAISTLHGMFLQDPLSSLFGLGFGAGTYSQFFQAPLYSSWGEVLHWTWFTDAQLYLETGLVGLGCYLAFFVVLTVRSLRERQHYDNQEVLFVEVGGVLSLFSILLVFYNCALTVDPGGYLVFLYLAMPLVVESNRKNDQYYDEVSK